MLKMKQNQAENETKRCGKVKQNVNETKFS